MEILLVEDDEVLAESFVQALMDSHTVTHVSTGKQALQFLEKDSFDILVLDLNLPDMNGFEILSNAQKINSSTPFIILTGDTNTENVMKSLKLGAFDYFLKPFPIKALIDSLIRFEDYNKSIISYLENNGVRTQKMEFEFSLEPNIYSINKYVFNLSRPLSLIPNISREEVISLKVVLNELISNAIEHGTAGINYFEKQRILETETDYFELVHSKCQGTAKKINISILFNKPNLSIRIEDQGEGFDLDSIPKPTANPTANLFSGRGIFLSKLNVDQLYYNPKGNVVTIEKKLSHYS